ncbi:hypothetical protein [Usitatibacter palustris]|uniref:hypothetical protein n=1 Tax=Usitatibacter palustris TaxID=2732487 RepID=UPI00148973C8|nr:hypothetical protein [Usitatibacter palustris]
MKGAKKQIGKVAAAGLMLAAFGAWATPTSSCNARPTMSQILFVLKDPPDPRTAAVINAARDPASNPALYARIQRPISVLAPEDANAILLHYDPIQDPYELSLRIRADGELMSIFPELLWTSGDVAICPAANPRVLREYHHSTLDHYYMASSNEEIAWIDQGGAGQGWARTGQVWTTRDVQRCQTPSFTPVYVFYGTPGIGPNSHYYTANPLECGYLRNTVGWSYVSAPFGALMPLQSGVCPPNAPFGLRLFYNNRAAQNDSNHRYVSDPAIAAQMRERQWIDYGVQLCVVGPGAP